MSGLSSFDPYWILLAARTEQPSPELSERLVMTLNSSEHWFTLVFTSRNLPPHWEPVKDASLHDKPMSFSVRLLYTLMPASELRSNLFRSRSGKVLEVDVQQPAGATASHRRETLLTKDNALLGGYRVLPLMHPTENQWQAPFVYADEHSLFSVHPNERVHSVHDYGGFYDSGAAVIPAEEFHVPPLQEAPLVPDRLGPVINPVDIIVNPAIERVIRNDNRFVYQGIAFDANGIANQELVQ